MNARILNARWEAAVRHGKYPYDKTTLVDRFVPPLPTKPHFILHVSFTAPANIPHDQRMRYAWWGVERENGTRTGNWPRLRDALNKAFYNTDTFI